MRYPTAMSGCAGTVFGAVLGAVITWWILQPFISFWPAELAVPYALEPEPEEDRVIESVIHAKRR